MWNNSPVNSIVVLSISIHSLPLPTTVPFVEAVIYSEKSTKTEKKKKNQNKLNKEVAFEELRQKKNTKIPISLI